MADKPIMREEKYLAYLTGDYKADIPKPITRQERYLYELCLKGMGGEISPEEIRKAVNDYLDKNPVKPGATTEEAAQIKKNAAEINSLKESKITKFYASNQGKTNLQDSDNGKIMDMMLYGKSEQKQYSGKNLLNATLQTTTRNGVTCTNNGDGTYTLNGTANGDNGVITSLNVGHMITKSGKYIVVGCPKGGSSEKYNLRIGKDDISWGTYVSSELGNGRLIDVTDNTSITLNFMINDGYTCNNLIFKPMIVDASLYPDATYDDFEPYVGGTPSPNPSYPQEILSVKNPTVKVCGKNLLNYDAWSQIDCANGKAVYENNGVTITALRNDAFTNYDMSKFPATARIPVNVGETITISWDEPLNKEGRVYVFGNASTSNMTYVNNSSSKQLKYTIPSGVTFITFRFGVGNAGDTISYRNIQIELGSTPTAYEPYHEQTVTLPYTLNAIPVSSGGNVTIDGQQYMSDYFDVERGKLVRMVEKAIALPTYVISQSAGNKNVFAIDFSNYAKAIKTATNSMGITCMSNKFESSNTVNTWNEPKNTIKQALFANKTQIVFITDVITIDDFKAILSTSETYVIYQCKPIEESIPNELAEKLKALQSRYPQTNILITSDELDGYTVFNYPISMENGWNYVKQQIGDTREYIYDMDARTQDTDLQAAEAYVNSEYAVALTELEV